MKKILVIGSSGQIGTELVDGLRVRFGDANVVACDIKEPQVEQAGPFVMVNAMDRRGIERIVEKYGINEVYLLAAPLMRPTKFPEIPVSLERNTEVFRHPLL